MDEEAIGMLADSGTYLVADLWNGDWIAEQGARHGWSPEVLRKNEETTQAQRRRFARCVEAGVRIAFGTDSGVYPHGMNAHQFAAMVEHGMTPLEAIRSATVTAAELLGWRDRVGAIEPGLLADLIAVRGDPLERVDVLTDVEVVVKGGDVVGGPDGRSHPLDARR
jgi:imidazolonepropionase-like amidohydrolase